MPHEEVKERNVECALQAAYELFLENGIEGTNKEKLVRASGISRSSIDRYFKDKPDLVIQTARWVGENLRDRNLRVHTQLCNNNESGIDMLRNYLELVRDLLYDNPRLFALSAECRAYVFRHCGSNGSGPEMLRRFLGSSILLRKIFEFGIEDGTIISEIDPDREAIMTRESVVGYFTSMALAGIQLLQEQQELADLYIARILKQYRKRET